jgi:hypothetical protein
MERHPRYSAAGTPKLARRHARRTCALHCSRERERTLAIAQA